MTITTPTLTIPILSIPRFSERYNEPYYCDQHDTWFCVGGLREVFPEAGDRIRIHVSDRPRKDFRKMPLHIDCRSRLLFNDTTYLLFKIKEFLRPFHFRTRKTVYVKLENVR